MGGGQAVATLLQLQAASLTGAHKGWGYLLSLALLAVGGWLLPPTFAVLLWTPICGLLAVIVLLIGGSFAWPPPDPERLFEASHSAHQTARWLQIPDGSDEIPGCLLTPSQGSHSEAAVCLLHGAGDSKIAYKWLLVRALLAEGLTVLTIDLPGHGDYRHRPLRYPEVLSTVPAALRFLRTQPGIRQVGVAGISLGGAVAVRSLAEAPASAADLADALVIVETPIRVNYSRSLFYREMWSTLYGAPVLWLLRELSIKQAWDTWQRGGYRSQHSTGELFDLLDPRQSIKRLRQLPILLVYSRRDRVAPPEHAQAMHQAAPQATLMETKKASHVVLTLMPEVNRQVARWLKIQLADNRPQ